ncbi:hypothetical protein OG943_01415 [Amycolatopsis sp. NBC_00345]|uniref:hypothetical protein n=1 Tax=Amycolatopsis sp. NBC_00345 TaxID=2975955 RepID=UPI002E259CA2
MPAALSSPANTMFMTLHGWLKHHSWWEANSHEMDAYSLFVARTSAMRLLADARQGDSGGAWGMNDAGEAANGESSPAPIAWFQVSWSDSVPVDRPIPAQPFLNCVGDVLDRIGEVRVETVQLVLPLQSLITTGGTPQYPTARTFRLAQDAGWFADINPRERRPIRVTIDSGRDPAIQAAASGMQETMAGFRHSAFVCDSYSLSQHDPLAARSPVVDQLWNGPPQHRVSFTGVLAEWSLNAIGWMAAFLSDTANRHGISTPILLTVSGTG